jgi:prepilin peptidase CpaA
MISVIATITDLFFGKIYNWLTAPAALIGLGVSFYLFGWSGILQSVAALLVGLALYGWIFGIRMIGGGDVKLLMALGAWGGIRYTFDVALLGVVLGGAMSIGVLLYKGKLFAFSRRMYYFLLSVLIKELEPQALKVDKNIKMPFGIPISIAAVWVAFRGGSPWF